MSKISLNKKFLSTLPRSVAEHIDKWRGRTHRKHIGVECVAKVTIAEDGRYTAFNPDGTLSKSASAVGEWNGLSGMMCNRDCPLPPGCWLIEEEIFLGQFYLRLYRGAPAAQGELPVGENHLLHDERHRGAEADIVNV